MNSRRRWALIFSGVGFLAATVCLVRTTPLTMVAFFNISLPAFALGILLYAYDLMTLLRRPRRKNER